MAFKGLSLPPAFKLCCNACAKLFFIFFSFDRASGTANATSVVKINSRSVKGLEERDAGWGGRGK